MSVKTVTATRSPAAGAERAIKSWHLSASTAAVVNCCQESSATRIFQVQVPANSSASQAYYKPIRTPGNGRWHIEVVSGALNRGAVDLV